MRRFHRCERLENPVAVLSSFGYQPGVPRLPSAVQRVEPADPPYPVRLSESLKKYRDEVTEEVKRRERS